MNEDNSYETDSEVNGKGQQYELRQQLVNSDSNISQDKPARKWAVKVRNILGKDSKLSSLSRGASTLNTSVTQCTYLPDVWGVFKPRAKVRVLFSSAVPPVVPVT